MSKNAGETCTKWPNASARNNLATLIESSDGKPQPIGSGARTLIKRSDNIANDKVQEIDDPTTRPPPRSGPRMRGGNGLRRRNMREERSSSDAGPEVRSAVSADAPEIQQLVNGIFGEYGLAIAVDGVDKHLAQPAEYFHARGGEFWVVEDGGRIVASVGALPHANDVVELKALYVHPSIRRQGWGRRLTVLVMDYARAADKRRVILWSDTRFTDAHRLYRGLGFREFGQRDLHDNYNSSEYGFECDLMALPV